MSIFKSTFNIMKNKVWDTYYLKTSSDQVVHTKTDGQASTVKEQLDGLNSALNKKADISTLSDIIDTRVVSKDVDIEANLFSAYSIPIPAVSGKECIGVCAFTTGAAYVYFARISITNDGATVEGTVKNTNTIETKANLSLRLLYVKN